MCCLKYILTKKFRNIVLLYIAGFIDGGIAGGIAGCIAITVLGSTSFIIGAIKFSGLMYTISSISSSILPVLCLV